MAHPRTEVADIAAYYSFIYPECYGTKQRKGLRQSRNWPQVGPKGPEESLRHGPLHFVFGLFMICCDALCATYGPVEEYGRSIQGRNYV